MISYLIPWITSIESLPNELVVIILAFRRIEKQLKSFSISGGFDDFLCFNRNSIKFRFSNISFHVKYKLPIMFNEILINITQLKNFENLLKKNVWYWWCQVKTTYVDLSDSTFSPWISFHFNEYILSFIKIIKHQSHMTENITEKSYSLCRLELF